MTILRHLNYFIKEEVDRDPVNIHLFVKQNIRIVSIISTREILFDNYPTKFFQLYCLCPHIHFEWVQTLMGVLALLGTRVII